MYKGKFFITGQNLTTKTVVNRNWSYLTNMMGISFVSRQL